MLSSLMGYSQFIYTLLTDRPTIQRHTIRIYPRGSLVGVVEGTIEFEQEVTLRIYERVDFARQQILAYSYEVWQGPLSHPQHQRDRRDWQDRSGRFRGAPAASTGRRLARSALVSAKQAFLTTTGINGVQSQLRIEQIFDELGQKLQMDEVLRLPLSQKIDKLATVLRAGTYFIVLDNLESIEDFRQLTPFLARLANPTQFLLTTRATIPDLTTVTEVNLDELDQPAAHALIQHTAQRKGVAHCDPTVIYDLVGGNPLAIILVVSQMQFLPVARVVEGIRAGAVAEMYHYIYWQAWQMLDAMSQEVLFTIQRAGDQADWAWLAMATPVAPTVLDRALRQLYALSLVHLQHDHNEQPTYAIHRLTSTFLRTEVLGWK